MSDRVINDLFIDNQPAKLYAPNIIAGLEDTDAVTQLQNGIAAEATRAEDEEARIEALFTAPTQEAVDNWLDGHPEATTTVQDGAITLAKLHPDVRADVEEISSIKENLSAVIDGSALFDDFASTPTYNATYYSGGVKEWGTARRVINTTTLSYPCQVKLSCAVGYTFGVEELVSPYTFTGNYKIASAKSSGGQVTEYLCDANANILVILKRSDSGTIDPTVWKDVMHIEPYPLDLKIITGKMVEVDANTNDISDVSAVMNAIKNSVYNYPLVSSLFELGTLWKSGTSISYGDATNTIRTVRNTTIALNKGDIVLLANSGYKARIYNWDDRTIGYEYTTNDTVIESSGNYVFAIATVDSSDIASIDDILEKVAIVRAESPIAKKILTLSDKISGVKNNAKGVFCVMSYNVGLWYNGGGTRIPAEDMERYLALQSGIIDRYMPDVLCLQEYLNEFSSGQTAKSLILNERYHFIADANGGSGYGGKAICTSQTLLDASNVMFESTESTQQRNYEKAYIYFNGKKVCVISTHLALGASLAGNEITELLTAINGEEYVIICMDSNIDAKDHTSADYIATLKQFTDAGYNLANDGRYITFAGQNLAIDNIVTTPNITVKSVIVDKQKEGLAEGSDHYPLIAYLEVF